MMEVPMHENRFVILYQEIFHRSFDSLNQFLIQRTCPTVEHGVQSSQSIEPVRKLNKVIICHPEGAFVATEGSLIHINETLRCAQSDMFYRFPNLLHQIRGDVCSFFVVLQS